MAMKMAVYPKTSAESVAGAEGIHLVRPVKARFLEKMLGITRKISMSASTYERLSKKAKRLIEDTGAIPKIERRQGRSLGTESSRIGDVVEMHRNFESYRDIEKGLGIPKSTAHYLIKYAKRSKLKKGGKVFYID